MCTTTGKYNTVSIDGQLSHKCRWEYKWKSVLVALFGFKTLNLQLMYLAGINRFLAPLIFFFHGSVYFVFLALSPSALFPVDSHAGGAVGLQGPRRKPFPRRATGQLYFQSGRTEFETDLLAVAAGRQSVADAALRPASRNQAAAEDGDAAIALARGRACGPQVGARRRQFGRE